MISQIVQPSLNPSANWLAIEKLLGSPREETMVHLQPPPKVCDPSQNLFYIFSSHVINLLISIVNHDMRAHKFIHENSHAFDAGLASEGFEEGKSLGSGLASTALGSQIDPKIQIYIDCKSNIRLGTGWVSASISPSVS